MKQSVKEARLTALHNASAFIEIDAIHGNHEEDEFIGFTLEEYEDACNFVSNMIDKLALKYKKRNGL